jgi:DNA-binding MarR family transcriptional regulator
MDEEEYYRLKSFLDRSKNRKKILEFLDSKDKALRPTDLSTELEVQRSTISDRILDLKEEELVKVLNPKDNRNRYYRITEKGKQLLEDF